ncbi:hypothetical protein TorRG33x02_058840 [Trema orientale]|uniref:Uncharacterized protein n=1 Tax=Trema orientale TaxID=63057 RepID=A0A2P5FKJ8_TREOI|nr:hypothetical protein TorRG33x02_058840 [Trema orientale]
MATIGPTYHGGDTSGEPPPNSFRIPAPRQLALIGKRKRSKNRSLNLQEKLDSLEPGQRLPILFDKTGATWRAVKENQKHFSRLIRMLVRKNITPFHQS